jgi:hypothetical protein
MVGVRDDETQVPDGCDRMGVGRPGFSSHGEQVVQREWRGGCDMHVPK